MTMKKIKQNIEIKAPLLGRGWKRPLFLLLFILTLTTASAQVGIGTTTPDASAILDITSTEKGFLPPRLTSAERAAITTPAQGLMIYNIDAKCLEVYNSTAWLSLCGSEGTLGGGGGTCTSTVNGVYVDGQPLTSTETVELEITVDTGGPYNITTNTVNGYSFSASGSFTTAGTKTVTLVGSGEPIAQGTDNFTVSYNGSTCDFSVTTSDVGVLNFDRTSTTDGTVTFTGDYASVTGTLSSTGNGHLTGTNNGLVMRDDFTSESTITFTDGTLYDIDFSVLSFAAYGANGVLANIGYFRLRLADGSTIENPTLSLRQNPPPASLAFQGDLSQSANNNETMIANPTSPNSPNIYYRSSSTSNPQASSYFILDSSVKQAIRDGGGVDQIIIDVINEGSPTGFNFNFTFRVGARIFSVD